MTTTQHTPGPWHIARRSHAEKRILVTKDGERVLACCSTGYAGKRGPIPEPERLANARLIAAAPELLAALQQAALVLKWAVQESKGKVKAEIVGGWSHHADKAMGIIAAATGEEVQP